MTPSNHFATSQVDDLSQQETEAVRLRMNEGDVGLRQIEVGREVAGGKHHPHHRGRRADVDDVGNRHKRADWGHRASGFGRGRCSLL